MIESLLSAVGKSIKFLYNSIFFFIAGIIDIVLMAFYHFATVGLEKPSGIIQVLRFFGKSGNPLSVFAGVLAFILTFILVIAAVISFVYSIIEQDNILIAIIKLIVAIALIVGACFLLSGLGSFAFSVLVILFIAWLIFSAY